MNKKEINFENEVHQSEPEEGPELSQSVPENGKERLDSAREKLVGSIGRIRETLRSISPFNLDLPMIGNFIEDNPELFVFLSIASAVPGLVGLSGGLIEIIEKGLPYADLTGPIIAGGIGAALAAIEMVIIKYHASGPGFESGGSGDSKDAFSVLAGQ